MTRILVLGDHRQSLTIARSLAERGDVVIAGVVEGRRSHVRFSRAVVETWAHPPTDGPSFPDALDAAMARFRPDVLFPVGDLEIRWTADRVGELGVPVAVPDSDVIRTCQSKPELLRLVTEISIPATPSTTVSTMTELEAAADRLGYPIFVKAHDTLLRVAGRKGIAAASPEDLVDALPAWPGEHERLIVQRYVEGTRHNVYYAADRGSLIGAVEVRIDRTNTPDGTGLAVDGRTIPLTPALLGHTERVIGELKYSGVGCTQFLVGDDGSHAFLELNPRLGANFAVVRAAGLDLASMAVDIALDRPVVAPATRTGIRYGWALGELDGLIDGLAAREIGVGDAVRTLARMGATAVAADVHVAWSWRDPLPALAGLWYLTGRRLLNHLRRALSHRGGRSTGM